MTRRGKDKGVTPLRVTPVSFAIVSEMYWIPVAEVDAEHVRRYFTVHTKVMDYTGKGGHTIQPISTYREDPVKRPALIGVPIAAGEQYFPTEHVIEELSKGQLFDQWTRLPDPNHPAAAPGQQEFMDLAMDSVEEQYTSLFKAETGTGKTVVSLGLAAQLRMSTVVLVPKTRLLKQWVDQAQAILGLPRKYIGIIQGQTCQHNKPFVVAMMKSLVQNTYPPEVYQSFGTMITDELHNTGAAMTSQVQGRFNAEVKFGLTATDKRRDGADEVYYSFYGKPAFKRTMPGVPTDVFVSQYSGPKNEQRRRDQILAALANDRDRNIIFGNIASRWYEEGDDVLMMTEYVDHAYLLRKMLMQRFGISGDDIGCFTAERPRKGGGREKTPSEYLDWCMEEPPILIATYGSFKEGLDAPRLNAGMDCLPRADMEQALGRVRRRMEGKRPYGKWFTLRDRNTPKAEGWYYGRMKSINHIESITIKKVPLEEMY